MTGEKESHICEEVAKIALRVYDLKLSLQKDIDN